MIKNLNRDLIQIGSDSKNKDELLKEIASLISTRCEKLSEKEIYKGLKKRENLSSTGLTQGIAIPHCMFDELQDFYVGVIVVKNGINFEALDSEDSKLIFFSVGPKSRQNEHITTLTSISKISKDEELLKKLIESENSSSIEELLYRKEDNDNASKIKCQFTIHIQDEKLFQDVLEILAADVEGSISVIEAQTAGYYLHKLPLFSSFWNDVSDSFSRMIIAVIDKRLMNETIRRINMVKPEDNTGLLMTVNELLYVDGSLEY